MTVNDFKAGDKVMYNRVKEGKQQKQDLIGIVVEYYLTDGNKESQFVYVDFEDPKGIFSKCAGCYPENLILVKEQDYPIDLCKYLKKEI